MKKMPFGNAVLIALLSVFLVFLACRKDLQLAKKSLTENSVQPLASTGCNGIIDSMPAVNYDGDSIERPTILGIQHVNPYLLPNMQQAYADLGITNVSVTVNSLYVRFLPNSSDQLAALDSTLDLQNLDLFDTPMDYDVIQEGDYYQDPSIPIESVTYQYAVVPTTFQFPAGISYTILAQIHIPGDAYTAVETEAERLASIQDCGGGQLAAVKPDGLNCNDPACHFDYTLQKCVCCAAGSTWNGTQCVPACQSGYYWNGSSCVPIPPPVQSPDAAIPAGNITVFDTQIPDNSNLQPLRVARIVVKRWFKIQRLYTDNNGHFVATKHFKHKVKIVVKFKNSDADIRAMRTGRLWQMVLPLSKTIGVYSGNKSSISYSFIKYNTKAVALGNRCWAAGTVHNAVQEYKDYAATEHIGLPQSGIKILLTSLSGFGSGSTPLFSKRGVNMGPQEYVLTFIAGSTTTFLTGGSLTAAMIILKHQVDMTISYNSPSSNYSSLLSDQLKTTAYHELTHTGEYAKLGNSWYSQFVASELSEVVNTIGSGNSPYGAGSNSTVDPIIGLGESWAYHIGHYFADKKFGVNYSSTAAEQPNISYPNNYPNSGLSSHLNVLENYIPKLPSDPFKWIPKGLYYDLIDNGEINSITTLVNDLVTGYTNSEIFNAIQSDVKSIPDFKARLVQQNPGNPTNNQMNSLFLSYGY